MPKAHDDDVVMNLVELALSRPTDAREAWLRTTCGDDKELFSQVWNYVQWNHRMQDFLLDPLYPSLQEDRFTPGELLADRFRIVREVARGGMGIVYEATDERLGRRIALKCARSGFRGRLPPEVRHASEISHPNVCKIFDIHTASTARGDIDFLTMEFIDGKTLAERLRAGPLTEAEAREIANQLCAGLAEAHRKGVVHGDLKTNNVILTSTLDGATRAVITDFGLARQPAGRIGENAPAQLLQSAPVAGAPAYMAPELREGKKPTPASDIYAFGVILRELVSGKRPEAPVVNTVDAQPTRKPPTLETQWDRALARCLDPDPARRFEDAGKLLQALEPPRSRRWLIGAIAAVLLAAAVSGFVTFRRTTAPRETVRLALLPFRSNPDTADLAAGLFRDTDVQLARLKGTSQTRAVVIRGSAVASKKVDTVAKARSVLAATHVFQVTVEKENGNDILRAYLTDTRSGVNTKESEMRYQPEQLRYAPVALAGILTSSLRLPSIGPRATVNAAARRAYLTGLSLLGNVEPDEPLATMQSAVAADPDSPLTWAGLAEAQLLKFGLTGDAAWKEKARESVRQAELRNPDLAEVHSISGWLKKDSSQYELAEVDLLRAVDLQPDNGIAWRRLGMTYESSGLLSQALTSLQRATQVRPDDFRNHRELGTFYIERSRYSEAQAEYQKMVNLAPNLSASHYALGLAFFNQRKYNEAENEFRAAIRIEDRSDAEQALATILSDEGKNREAAEEYLKAIRIGPATSLLWLDLGLCYSREGLETRAMDAFRKGRPLAEMELTGDTRNGRERANLAYLEARLQDRSRAELDIDNALQLSQDDTTRVMAVLTYEALGGEEHRKRTLDLLASSPPLLADVKSFPELADLRRDPRYLKLLSSNHVQ
jgi:eukaryotic-like serine/threonine-protein kinase